MSMIFQQIQSLVARAATGKETPVDGGAKLPTAVEAKAPAAAAADASDFAAEHRPITHETYRLSAQQFESLWREAKSMGMDRVQFIDVLNDQMKNGYNHWSRAIAEGAPSLNMEELRVRIAQAPPARRARLRAVLGPVLNSTTLQPAVEKLPAVTLAAAAAILTYVATSPDKDAAGKDLQTTFSVKSPARRLALSYFAAVQSHKVGHAVWNNVLLPHAKAAVAGGIQLEFGRATNGAIQGVRIHLPIHEPMHRAAWKETVRAIVPPGHSFGTKTLNGLRGTVTTIRTMPKMFGPDLAVALAVDAPFRMVLGDNYAARPYVMGAGFLAPTFIDTVTDNAATKFFESAKIGRGLSWVGRKALLPLLAVELFAMDAAHTDDKRNSKEVYQDWANLGQELEKRSTGLRWIRKIGVINHGLNWVVSGEAPVLSDMLDGLESALVAINWKGPADTYAAERSLFTQQTDIEARSAFKRLSDLLLDTLSNKLASAYFEDGTLDTSPLRPLISDLSSAPQLLAFAQPLAGAGSHPTARAARKIFTPQTFHEGSETHGLQLANAISYIGGEAALFEARDMKIYQRLFELELAYAELGMTLQQAVQTPGIELPSELHNEKGNNLLAASTLLELAVHTGYLNTDGTITENKARRSAYFRMLARVGREVTEFGRVGESSITEAKVTAWRERKLNEIAFANETTFDNTQRYNVTAARLLNNEAWSTLGFHSAEITTNMAEEVAGQQFARTKPQLRYIPTNPEADAQIRRDHPEQENINFSRPGIDPAADQAFIDNAEYWEERALTSLTDLHEAGINPEVIATEWNTQASSLAHQENVAMLKTFIKRRIKLHTDHDVLAELAQLESQTKDVPRSTIPSIAAGPQFAVQAAYWRRIAGNVSDLILFSPGSGEIANAAMLDEAIHDRLADRKTTVQERRIQYAELGVDAQGKPSPEERSNYSKHAASIYAKILPTLRALYTEAQQSENAQALLDESMLQPTLAGFRHDMHNFRMAVQHGQLDDSAEYNELHAHWNFVANKVFTPEGGIRFDALKHALSYDWTALPDPEPPHELYNALEDHIRHTDGNFTWGL